MANDEWRAHYPASEVEYLEMIESDHRPSIIKIRRTTDRGIRPFQFDTRLCQRPELSAVIESSWNSNRLGHRLTILDRIKNCRSNISAWKRQNNTNSALRIKELIKIIDRAHSDGNTTTEHIHELQQDLLQAYRDEEKYWQLKSRCQWMNEGDRNTKFFNAFVKNRIARNRLKSIKDHQGADLYGNKEIAVEAERFFGELFSKPGQSDLNELYATLSQ
ncbi:PREDICTED: uncharacterized protein LOC104773033 [Camelina sativa]|uniref:Uncharacterized protein LOC104773033 n=1 Tax=Camelina sativa TaxID=90675 RepID=A0ABM0Y5J5_CAMSA|nr:PREDICTED: uncharacterized protein LOC104773033 [Camelina sativa]